MRKLIMTMIAVLGLTGSAFAQTEITAHSFDTVSNIAMDGANLPLSTVVATIEPRAGTNDYFWLRLHFYSFPPNIDDMNDIVTGNVKSMDHRADRLPADQYNKSSATLQLTLDKKFAVTQVDLSIPGYGCTIVAEATQLNDFSQNFRIDGNMVTLKNNASYSCDLPQNGTTVRHTFALNLNVDSTVFRVAKP